MKQTVIALTVLFLAGCSQKSQVLPGVDTRLQLGLLYLEQRAYPLAQRHLRQAMTQAPDDYRSHLAMARYHHDTGDNTQAARSYKTARQLQPKNRDVINNYGAFLCRLGQYDAAQQQFEIALKSSSGDARRQALENAGYCYLNAGVWKNAKALLIEATAHDPVRQRELLAEARRRKSQQEFTAFQLLTEVYHHRASDTGST
ncbi:MAG: Beta-barrel assembly-enhancing protease [Candidatus Erwinia impunctatus]|nr:Beta-barrel assembly-enhancing protease [Culicoides impunctatus]